MIDMDTLLDMIYMEAVEGFRDPGCQDYGHRISYSHDTEFGMPTSPPPREFYEVQARERAKRIRDAELVEALEQVAYMLE